MRKTFLIGMVLILMLFLLPSCAAGISREEYDRVSSDLAAAQTQNQSLQADLTEAQADLTEAQADLTEAQADLTEAQAQIQSLQRDGGVAGEKCIEALAYAEYFDVLMNPVWKDAGLTPRFVFEDEIEWMLELRSRASDMGDTELTSYVKELGSGDEATMQATMTALWDYCLDRIEEALK